MNGNQIDELQPLAGYLRMLGRVRWIFLAALLGGCLGIGMGWLLPPRYRAAAVLAIGVDYSRSIWLDEDADMLAMRSVQELILSDDVLGGALELMPPSPAGAQPELDALPALRSRLRLVWVDNRWELSASSTDPAQAASTANAWAEAALEQLAEATQHALRAAELQSLFFRVYCAPRPDGEDPVNALWVCDEGIPSFATMDLGAVLIDEVKASRGIIPALTFAWGQRASPPAQPLTGPRAVAALGGMLAGLIVGAILALAIRPAQVRSAGQAIGSTEDGPQPGASSTDQST